MSPEDDVELRRITVTNHSSEERVIELTSYAEVALAPPGADKAHPAFGNLFVQTEFVPKSSAILCTRRPRYPEERPPWMLHLMVVQGGGLGEICCETDRLKFVGRGGSLASPDAMRGGSPALEHRRVRARPHRLAPAGGRPAAPRNGNAGPADRHGGKPRVALAQMEKYQSPRMTDRAFDLAWTHSQVTLRQLSVTEGRPSSTAGSRAP